MPFIARYRKEAPATSTRRIRAIQEKLEYFRELEARRETVLTTIQEQGKLTAELRARIEAVLEKNELEDLYLPFKPKRRTKASIAREKGLEPLAQYLWDQKPGGPPLADYAATYSMASEEALEGLRHIVAEWISENAEFRKTAHARAWFDRQQGDRRRRGSRRQIQDVRASQRGEGNARVRGRDPALHDC